MQIEQSNQQLIEQSLVFIDLPAFGYVMFISQEKYSYEIFAVFTILYLLSYAGQYHSQINKYGRYQILVCYMIKVILIWLCSFQSNNWIYLVTFILQVKNQPISENFKQVLWLLSGLLNIFNHQSALCISFIEILSFAQLSFCLFVYTQIQNDIPIETSRDRTIEQILQSSDKCRSIIRIEPQQPWEKLLWLKHQQFLILNEECDIIKIKLDHELAIDELFNCNFQIDTFTPAIAYFQDFSTTSIKELIQEFKEYSEFMSIFISGKCDKLNFQINIFYAQDCFELNIIIHLIPIKQLSLNSATYLLRDICHSVSHELGTNLNCISTLASVYAEMASINSHVRKDILSPISTNCEQLNLIISNIRDYGSLETDQFQLKIGQFNLNQEINNILKFYTQTLKEKQIELNFTTQYQEYEVVSDRDRFRQVFYQLISNAIRYTSKGIITIRTELKSNIAYITVEDTGIGMNKQEQINLKSLLQQHLLQKVSQNSIGAGLGLFVSNMIVRKLNNDDKLFIEFQSEENIGAEFKFTLRSYIETLKCMNKITSGYNKSVVVLPEIGSYYEKKFQTFQTQVQRSCNNLQPKLSQSQSKEISLGSDEKQDSSSNTDKNALLLNTPKFEFNLQQTIQAPTLKSKCCAKVLIVDDEYFNILALNTLLLKYHTISDSAYNGVEAINKVLNKARSPCKSCCNDGYYVIFLDINMPLKGGLETVIELKQMMKEEKIPQSHCIANTAFCDLKTRMDSYAAGMDYFLTKPLSIANINEIFDELFPQL